MAEETLSGGGSTASICPWCSASYHGDPVNCPSCGAVLAGEAAADPTLPGLTAIDTAAIVRAKTPTSRPRNRLISWISGEYPDDAASATDLDALQPPDAEVRREILRLELEAEVANLQAEAGALMAEAAVDGGADAASPAAQAADQLARDLEAVSTSLHQGEPGNDPSAAEGVTPVDAEAPLAVAAVEGDDPATSGAAPA